MHSNVATTIRIGPKVAKALAARKLHARETYEKVLERMLEDLTELDEQTKRDIEEALRAIEAGDFKTQDQVRQALGL
jgi:predicted transcriptional regulator